MIRSDKTVGAVIQIICWMHLQALKCLGHCLIYRWVPVVYWSLKQAFRISSGADYHIQASKDVFSPQSGCLRACIHGSGGSERLANHEGGGTKAKKQVCFAWPVQVSVEVSRQTNLISCWKQIEEVSLLNLEAKTAAPLIWTLPHWHFLREWWVTQVLVFLLLSLVKLIN